ncbi:transferrin-binding protein-like solute binding protein [Cardiobacterium valvarum]|uniref:transferrin-binding protein-like solute binding protein n=1 Tax=Cardiobacterium valvarum TaxID=194702 RepID=UPI0035E4FD8A
MSGCIKAERDSNIQFNPICLIATINGSTNSAGVNTAGHSYGDNARELGGIFHDSTQNLSGSYGAMRDDD